MLARPSDGGPMSFRLLALLASLLASPAHAVFHLAEIDEVMSGVNGDSTIQYVEIRMLLAGQNQVCHTRLTVFRCQADGGSSQVLIDDLGGPSAVNSVTGCGSVTNSGPNVRWIMASPSASTFLMKSNVTPDFTWDNSATGNIPTSCGMVCWGAPGGIFAPPEPPSFNAADPTMYTDCVAYGSYDGTPEPGGNPPASATPGNGALSLTKTDTAMFSNQFQLACPTPENDAANMGSFGPCSPSTTTTSTAVTTTATTTATTGIASTTTSTTLPGKSKCSARELAAAGRKASAKLKCESNAVAKGNSGKLSACIGKAAASFAR